MDPLIDGRGTQGSADGTMQGLMRLRLTAPDIAGRDKTAKALSHVAMTDVATTIVGQWCGKTALRHGVTGVPRGTLSYPWPVRST